MLTQTPISPAALLDPALRPIADKVLAAEPLSHADGVALYASRDIHGIGRLANFVRESLHGDKAFYNRNRHINYTNVCALSCKFCSFYRKRGEEGAYEMPLEQVIATAQKAADAGATEVHIVGGLHPWLKFDYYLDMLRGIRAACPTLHIKAFTAIEIVHFTRVARMSVHDVLAALKHAGLGSLPGGGAEIFDDRVHDEVFKGKVRADRWFEVHRTAHSLGLYTNATMLYGHVETPAERIGHFIALRELQAESLEKMQEEEEARRHEGTKAQSEIQQEEARRHEGTKAQSGIQQEEARRHEGTKAQSEIQQEEARRHEGTKAQSEIQQTADAAAASPSCLRASVPSCLPSATLSSPSCLPSATLSSPSCLPSRACFNCVIPLSFIPEQSELGYLPGPTGLTDLKTLAIARLMLHNIAHIKAFWIMQGIGLSQLALSYGCDDLDGTVVWYDITKRAGDGTHQELHVSDIRRLIREAGRVPVERDTLYHEVMRGGEEEHRKK